SERRGNLGESPMRELLKRLGYKTTVHGMRSAFRDWCGEGTHFARGGCEGALWHASPKPGEAAFRRGPAPAKRRAAMNAWASFCDRPIATGATVTPLRKAVADA